MSALFVFVLTMILNTCDFALATKGSSSKNPEAELPETASVTVIFEFHEVERRGFVQHYEITKKELGTGAFSIVRRAQYTERVLYFFSKTHDVAMKIALSMNERSVHDPAALLTREFNIYSKISDSLTKSDKRRLGISHVIGIGILHYLNNISLPKRVMVMELFEMTLEDFRGSLDNQIDEQDIVRMGLKFITKSLKTLQHIHSKGVLHRDIKPDSFLLRRHHQTFKNLRLSDYGGVVEDTEVQKTLSGSLNYYSVNFHDKCDLPDFVQTKKDDVEGLLYVFIWFKELNLGWAGFDENEMNQVLQGKLNLFQDLARIFKNSKDKLIYKFCVQLLQSLQFPYNDPRLVEVVQSMLLQVRDRTSENFNYSYFIGEFQSLAAAA